jgi:replicative DNA helicase
MRVPPNNQEAEQSVLGGLMLDAESWDAVSEVVEESDFYRPGHQKIYAAIQELHRRGSPADIITVTNYLTDKSQLEEVGGSSYLAEIMTNTVSSANIATYAKIVYDKSILRQLIGVSNRVTERAYDSEFDAIENFIDQVEGEVFNISEKKKTQGLVAVRDLVKTSLDIIEERYKRKATMTGISTGYTELDKMTSGFQPGDLIIIAARPSMGKTAFCLNIAEHVAFKEKKAVAFFSVEMGKEALMMRILSSESRVPISNVRNGNIPDAAWPNLIHAATVIADSPLYIDDSSGISPFEIRSKARRLKRQKGCDMIIVDYLQIMDLKMKVENRERQVSEISKTLKSIAKELQIPVIALSQLNRGVEGRAERQPMLSDLRESGSIEQDADLIIMLYREDYYDKENAEEKGIAEILIRKQRNGPTGTVRLKWQAEIGRFENLETRDIPPPRPSSGPPRHHGGGKIPNLAPGNT